MLASVEKGFVLLSNPKTGTTALEATFGKFADIRTGGSPKWKHINYDRMTAIFGDYFQSQGCTIYGVVRHPIDALVSWYRYRSRPELKKSKHRWHDKYTGEIPFSQFVEEWAARSSVRARVPVSVQWCLTRGDRPAPMTFYRYEDLGLLHEALCGHVGRPLALKRKNVSPERPIDVDRAAVSALPRMREFIEIYDSIPVAGR
jgi:hypothetical protein